MDPYSLKPQRTYKTKSLCVPELETIFLYDVNKTYDSFYCKKSFTCTVEYISLFEEQVTWKVIGTVGAQRP